MQVSLPGLVRWRFHTLLTYAFSHVDPKHLFSNMFSLCFFGSSVMNPFTLLYILLVFSEYALLRIISLIGEEKSQGAALRGVCALRGVHETASRRV
jgi:membrane associated rhomboid family serine protease